MQIEETVVALCRSARQAARALATATPAAKNAALTAAARELRQRAAAVLDANREDVAAGRRNGLSAALIDRLSLDDTRLEAMARGLDDIAALPDPVGETIAQWRRPNGLEISQVRVPLGVVGVIYESRPNVTADAAGLCLKSGNAVVLKGGSEAFTTNSAIAACLAAGTAAAHLPVGAVQLIPTTDRRAVAALLAQRELVDVIVPRGGTSLIQAITESSSIPVIQHYAGICHVYVDDAADLGMAERIAVNAKVQRPGVCNAMETLLVHDAVAERFLPLVARPLRAAGVELRGCPRTRAILPGIAVASEEGLAPSIST
jgi:glutamate-5-semialdehyde dehydrogenase